MLQPSLRLPPITQEVALNTIRLNRAFGGVEGRIIQLGRHLAEFGVSMSLAVSIPLQIMAGAVIASLVTLDDAITKAFSKIVDASQGVKQQMMEGILAISATTRTSALDLAGGLTDLVASGYSAEAALQALGIANKLAVAGTMALDESSKTLITTMTSLGLKTNSLLADQLQMIRISDVLVKAADATVGSVGDFALALDKKAATALRTVNKSLEEGVAVLMAYIQSGVSAASASEYLNITIRDLQTSLIRKRDTWKKFGLSVYDAQGNMKNMADIIEMMENRFKGASDEQLRMSLRMLGFQDRSIMATMKLLGLSKQIRQYQKDLENAGGITQKVYSVQMTSFGAQMDITKNQLTAASVALGQLLIPTVMRLNLGLRNLIVWWNHLSVTTKIAVVRWALLAAVAGPLAIAMGVLLLMIGRLVAVTFQIGFAITRLIGSFVGLAMTLYGYVWPAITQLQIVFWRTVIVLATFTGAVYHAAMSIGTMFVTGLYNGITGLLAFGAAMGRHIHLLRLSYQAGGLVSVMNTILNLSIIRLAAMFNYLGATSLANLLRHYAYLISTQGFFAATMRFHVITAIRAQIVWLGFLIRQLGITRVMMLLLSRTGIVTTFMSMGAAIGRTVMWVTFLIRQLGLLRVIMLGVRLVFAAVIAIGMGTVGWAAVIIAAVGGIIYSLVGSGGLTEAFQGVKVWFKDALNWLGSWFPWVASGFRWLGGKIADAWHWITGTVTGGMESMTESFKEEMADMMKSMDAMLPSLMPGGGMIETPKIAPLAANMPGMGGLGGGLMSAVNNLANTQQGMTAMMNNFGNIEMPEFNVNIDTSGIEESVKQGFLASGVMGMFSPSVGMAMGASLATGMTANMLPLMPPNLVDEDFEMPGAEGDKKGKGGAKQFEALEYGSVEEYKARIGGQAALLNVAQKQLTETKTTNRKISEYQLEMRALTAAVIAETKSGGLDYYLGADL